VAANEGLGFGVLGPLQMHIAGAEVPLGSPKQRAVLAMLVMNRNRPVSIDSLLGAAWQQCPPAGARASLHSYVSSLRGLIASGGIDARTALVRTPPGYRLNANEIDCDLGRFVIENTPECRRPLRRTSRQPAVTSPPRWRSGAVRCSRTCTTSVS
jgi:SARP family transcriptional regulator, regulator of embCAB operon